jgi:uncharacterized protein YqfA (UPF0365 family)
MDLGQLIGVGLLVLVAVFFYLVPVPLWITAQMMGVQISPSWLAGMRLRGVPATKIVNPMIKAHVAKIPVEGWKLEALFLAGGDPGRVVDALVKAQQSGNPLSFDQACAIDLASQGKPAI